MKCAIAFFVVVLCCGCLARAASREEWQKMPPEEKRMYVRTLLGHEQVAERKGGVDTKHTAGIDEYVTRVDARYAAGDARTVDEVWRDLGEKKR